RRLLDIALRSPVAIPYIFEMYDRIKRGQLRIKDVIQISNPADNGPPGTSTSNSLAAEPPPINQEAAMENLQKQLEKIRRHQKEIEKLQEQLAPAAPEEASVEGRQKVTAQIEDHRRSCIEAITDMNLSRRPIDGIVEELSQFAERVTRAARDLVECERRAGMDLKELRGLFKDVRLSEEEEFKLCRRLGLHPSELHEIEARMRLATKRIRQVEQETAMRAPELQELHGSLISAQRQ